MSRLVKQVFREEMRQAKALYRAGELDQAFHRLERAHIVGQRYLWAHVRSHVWMLRVGLRRGDPREVLGQAMRVFASFPAYVLGWVPVGNTGGTDVSPVKRMRIPEDLSACFAGYSLTRGILIRVAILALVVVLLGWYKHSRSVELAGLERSWAVSSAGRATDFGSTQTLEVIPLINWHARSPEFRTEAGVSLLIKTDRNTILFDTGWNQDNETPSPLEHNMQLLGIKPDSIDTVFISHAHHDHVGGLQWERAGSFSLGKTRSELPIKRAFAPLPLAYPGMEVETITTARPLLEGVASTGPIARQLAFGRVDEQALVVNLEGKGLVVIVGCGHQTVPKLLERLEKSFDEPVYALVGDLHYPVPRGRRTVAGIDLQRRFASGKGILDPITLDQVNAEMAMLEEMNLELIALGGHDTSDEVIAQFAKRFGQDFRLVEVGTEIIF